MRQAAASRNGAQVATLDRWGLTRSLGRTRDAVTRDRHDGATTSPELCRRAFAAMTITSNA